MSDTKLPPKIEWDRDAGVLVVDGMRVAVSALFSLARDTDVGKYLRIDARKDGTITLTGFSAALCKRFDEIVKANP